MVSTISCPQCGTKNSKTAEVCHKCKKHLKIRKKPAIFNFNTESKIDLKIIAIGTIIFVLSNIIILSIAPDYSILISGFVTLLFVYLIFKNSEKSKGSSAETRDLGLKVIINYLIMAIIGIIIIYVLSLYNIIKIL